jgi:cellulose 1,4-beta-cellobiosidase
VGAPGAPTGLTGGSATGTSITLNWTAPLDNGGATITQYAVRSTTDNGVTWLTPYAYGPVGNPAATTLTFTGLTPATSYRFQVVAQNSVGWGAYSASSPTVSTTP